MIFLGEFAWAVWPVSWISMDSYSAEMDNSGLWYSDCLSIICQRLWYFADDLGDVNNWWHEAKGFIDAGPNHAIP